MTNALHTPQLGATKLWSTALGWFSQQPFLFIGGSLFSEAASTNSGRIFEPEGALGDSLAHPPRFMAWETKAQKTKSSDHTEAKGEQKKLYLQVRRSA